jgi:hypothetical protein
MRDRARDYKDVGYPPTLVAAPLAVTSPAHWSWTATSRFRSLQPLRWLMGEGRLAIEAGILERRRSTPKGVVRECRVREALDGFPTDRTIGTGSSMSSEPRCLRLRVALGSPFRSTTSCQSPVAGSMTVATCVMTFAGNPPQRACSSMMSLSGAT